MKKKLRIIFFCFLFGCDEVNSNKKKTVVEKIYSTHCSGCHDSGFVRELSPNSLDLPKIVYNITYGGHGMPSFKNILSEEEINSLAQYIIKSKK